MIMMIIMWSIMVIMVVTVMSMPMSVRMLLASMSVVAMIMTMIMAIGSFVKGRKVLVLHVNHHLHLFVKMMNASHVTADGLGKEYDEHSEDHEFTEKAATVAAMGATSWSMRGDDGDVHLTARIWFCDNERFVSHWNGFV
mmetsp:Transcript_6412/g.9400  ORF Transcript_6412/g.9400 Transcript_6412/m.9400 type:complete len:140 (-) Transcript_6412:112-531(-)